MSCCSLAVFLNGGKMLYNVVLVSTIQHHESVINIYKSSPS